MEVRGDLTSVCGFNLLTYIVIVLIVGYVTSTLHCRGKNGRSKKIGQTNQKMIHFVPNMYVSGTISALRPGTQTGMIFGIWNSKKKTENYLEQRDFRICGFLRFFAFFFVGFLRFFLWGFAGFLPSRLMRCKHFLALSHQAQNHAIKVLKSKTKVVSMCFG